MSPASTTRALCRLGKAAESLDGGRRRRRRLWAVPAVGRSISLRALGLRPPARREVLYEGVERRLLGLRDERVLDRFLDLRERRLARWLDPGDREDQVAVVRAD